MDMAWFWKERSTSGLWQSLQKIPNCWESQEIIGWNENIEPESKGLCFQFGSPRSMSKHSVQTWCLARKHLERGTNWDWEGKVANKGHATELVTAKGNWGLILLGTLGDTTERRPQGSSYQGERELGYLYTKSCQSLLDSSCCWAVLIL